MSVAKKKYSGSLARRILSICFVLIIIPLIFYSAVIWDRDFRIKLSTIFSELQLMGDSGLEIYNEWHALSRAQLESFDASLSDESLSTLFIFNQNFQVEFFSLKAADADINFFPDQLELAYQRGDVVFAAFNRVTNREEIFVLRRFGEEIRGLSLTTDAWLKKFAAHSRFDLTLIDQSGKAVFSTNPSLKNELKKIFTLSEVKSLQNHLSFLKTHSLRNKHLALRLTLPQALFDLQIEMSQKQIAELEGGNFFHRLIELVLMVILLGGLGTWWLAHRMSKPLHQFTHVMDAMEAKDYSRRYLEDRLGFEINALGLKFNEMMEILLRNMEEAKNERVKKELLFNELQIGRLVQKELLPKEIPQFPGLKVGVGFAAAKEVGGDFYDLFVKDQDQLMLSIADASDKGISACLYSLVVRSMLRSFALSEERLSDVVLKANNLFYRDASATSNFVTAWVGFYHIAQKKLLYSSAGHLPALLLHADGQVEELTTSGIALGVSILEKVEVKAMVIPSGSLLFLYTDGVTETHNEKGELFGKSRLFEFLSAHRTLEPQQLIDKLVAELDYFAKEIAQHDDLTILCLKHS